MTQHQVVIVGAGPAGLAAALSLRDRGLRPLLCERADQVASSWRARYDRLKLNTGRQFSHLPRRPYPKGTPTFPTRDQFVEHLEQHAADVDIRFGCEVQQIYRGPLRWRLRTSDGDIDARHVIVSTGYEHHPHIPDWPGLQDFTGVLLHSAAYRNPRPYIGKHVLVIGAGTSGMEIAYDLADGGAAKVWLAVRNPPNIVARNGPFGLPGDAIGTPLYWLPPRLADRIALLGRQREFGDLTEWGLTIPADGPFTRLNKYNAAPAIVDIDVINAIKDGTVEIVRDPASFADITVSLTDGRQLQPDVVVCATGYRCGLEQLVGHLGVLEQSGAPAVRNGQAADGLWFLGFLSRPSLIGHVSRQSRRIAKQISNDLRRRGQMTAAAIAHRYL